MLKNFKIFSKIFSCFKNKYYICINKNNMTYGKTKRLSERAD